MVKKKRRELRTDR
uniref:Uncharacterized protein n=1 Tax=Arundo donax TaxID=35708 RepID=A0A0A9BQC4_ARUDO